MQLGDIKSVRLLWIKGALFLFLGILAGFLILVGSPQWRTGVLLAVCIWAFCRAYYFAFYVVEHYAEPGYKFAGLMDFARYALRRKTGDKTSHGESGSD